MSGDGNVTAGKDFASTIDTLRDVIFVTGRVFGHCAVHNLSLGHVSERAR